jgi:uncharacterized protein
MELPSDAAILTFHQDHALSARAFNVVYTHSRIVADIADQIIVSRQLSLNSELVHAAALLHDVGYYSLFNEVGYVPHEVIITHGVVGAALLRETGMPEAIARIAERHTGIGLTREHILKTNLPLPAQDFVPETPEELLVMYADKLHTKYITSSDPTDTTGRFNTPDMYLVHARHFGEANAARFAALVEQYGVPDLEQLSEQYGQSIR